MKPKEPKIEYPEIGRKYLHYKGGKYEIITLAKHSETNEDLVIYKSIHFGSVHARPLKMWFEKVDGEIVAIGLQPRFKLIEE